MSWLAKLVAVLISLESGGDPGAVGPDGELGILQIRAVMVDDVNRIYGTMLTHEQMLEPRTAVATCRLYLLHWGRHYERTTGLPATPEVLARIFNGGPEGWRKPVTQEYGQRAENILKKKEHIHAR